MALYACARVSVYEGGDDQFLRNYFRCGVFEVVIKCSLSLVLCMHSEEATLIINDLLIYILIMSILSELVYAWFVFI